MEPKQKKSKQEDVANDTQIKNLSDNMDKKVLLKRKLEDERELAWQRQKEKCFKMREEKKKLDEMKEREKHDKIKQLSKLKEKKNSVLFNTDKVELLETKTDKSLPNSVKQILGDEYELERIPGDGACGMGSFAKHSLDDASLGPEIGEILNKDIADNFWYYKQLIEYSYSRNVGGSEPVRFEKNEEEKLLNFLRNHPRNGFVWRGFMDMQALSNKYGMPIKIFLISNFNDPNPKVERMEPDGGFEVKEKIDEMILLNTGRVHFDLIRKKKKSVKVLTPAPQDCPPGEMLTQGLLRGPSEKVLEPNNSNKKVAFINDEIKEINQTASEQPQHQEIIDLKVELAESKEEIKALKELVCQLLPGEEPDKLVMKTPNSTSEHQDKLQNNTCSKCGKDFARYINLEVHVRQEHQELNKFDCITCKKSYSIKENLWAHIEQNHVKKFDCDSCEKSFKTEQELKLHDEEDHTNNYDCEQCDYQSSSESLLNKHIEIKHLSIQKECKGVGSKPCGKMFNSYNDLMDHRRDEHNSGNKVCHYYKEGSCYFISEDKGKCWYLHQDIDKHSTDTTDEFDCKSCEKKFKTRYEVMNHRKDEHEDEVPLCKDFVEGKKCSRNRCWFSHKKNMGPPNMSCQIVKDKNNLVTNSNNSKGFWHPQQSSEPPDQLTKMMEMISALTTEVSQLKMKFQQNN